MSWYAVGVAVVSAVATSLEQKQTAKRVEREEDKRNALESRVEGIRARDALAKSERQRRAQAAQAESQAVIEGSGGASSTQGVTASLDTQAAVNIGNINTNIAARTAGSAFNQNISNIQSKGQQRQSNISAFTNVAGAIGTGFESKKEAET